nr:hypothetical protein [uncultured Marinifilum sp.]
MVRIYVLVFSVFLLLSCGETLKVIEVRQVNSDLPVVLKYSQKYKTVSTINFPVEFEVYNSSMTNRKLSNITYHYKGDIAIGSSRSYIREFDKLIRMKRNSNYSIIKKKTNRYVCYSRHFVRDTARFSREYFSDLLTQMENKGQDSLVVSNLKEFASKNKELVEYLLVNDMIFFEFDDTQVKFSKKSKIKKLLPSYSKDSIEMNVDYPVFKLPVKW